MHFLCIGKSLGWYFPACLKRREEKRNIDQRRCYATNEGQKRTKMARFHGFVFETGSHHAAQITL
jgi:hypothetical protein